MSDIIRKFGDNYFVTEYANRSDWLKGRHNYLGASDAASVLGISPWMTDVQLYENKVNPVVDEKPPTEQMLRGIKSESHIRDSIPLRAVTMLRMELGRCLSALNIRSCPAHWMVLALTRTGNRMSLRSSPSTTQGTGRTRIFQTTTSFSVCISLR